MNKPSSQLSVYCCASNDNRLDRLQSWLAGPNIYLRGISSIYELLYLSITNAPELIVLSVEIDDLSIDDVVHELLEAAPFSNIVLLVPSAKLQQFHFLSEISTRISVIVEDPQGQFVGRILGLIRLQQERQPTIEPLNGSLLGDLLGTLPDAVIILDDALNIVYANQKTIDLVDLPAENFVGKGIIEKLNEDSQQQTKKVIQEYLKQGQSGREYLQLMLKHDNGETVPCRANYAISTIHKKKFVLLTLHDETDLLLTTADRIFQEQFEKYVMRLSNEILGTKVSELPRVMLNGLKDLSALLGYNRLQVLSLKTNYFDFQKFLCWPQLRKNETSHELNWLNRTVFQRGRVSILDTHSLPLDAMEEFDWLRGLKMHAVAAIPVNINEKETGILLAFKKKAYQWNELDFSRLGSISSLIKSLLSRLTEMDNLKKTKEDLVKVTRHLSHLAKRDDLTGLANRRLFDQTLSQEIRRSARQRSQLSLIMADIDYFKDYNDSLGHVAGDKCLKGMGAALDAVFQRAGDLPARYGGEEFVIILPGTGKEDALKEAQRLKQAIKELNITHPASQVSSRITMSMGVSTIENSLIDMSEFIQQADKALYFAKNQGRNNIVHHLELIDSKDNKQQSG